MLIGYARVSTIHQSLERQRHALAAAGVHPDATFTDTRSGSTRDRAGLRAALAYARAGDVLVVHTLDRLGRNVRDTLNLIHELRARDVGVRNLADPIRVDSSDTADPLAQLAVVLLALFGEMERAYSRDRAAHARAVATEQGRRTGRPSTVTADQLEHARLLRDSGASVARIVEATGIPRSTLYRHLEARPAPELPDLEQLRDRVALERGARADRNRADPVDPVGTAGAPWAP